MSAFRHMLLFNSQSKYLTAWMLESPWRFYIIKKWKQQLFKGLIKLFVFLFFAKNSRLYPKLCLRESGLSGDFSSLLCRNCLLNSAVMRLVMQGCCWGQNTKCSMQVRNKIISAHRLPANFKQCPLENSKCCQTLKCKNLKATVGFLTFCSCLCPFSTGTSSVIDRRSDSFSASSRRNEKVNVHMGAGAGFAIGRICSASSLHSLCKY